MTTMVDAKFAALRGMGFTGAMPDMELKWLIANGPQSPNLYLNPELAGGAASGPVAGDFPPDDHGLGFNTTTGIPEAIGGGNFQWHFNEARISARAYLTYNIAANHPALVIGTNYRIRWLARNPTGSNYGAALNLSSVVDIDLVDDHRAAAPNATTELFTEFRVTSGAYAAIARIGVGTTSNNAVELDIFEPTFVNLDTLVPTAKTIPDAWRQYLAFQGFATGNRNDDRFAQLGSLGHTGALADREFKFWLGGG